MASSYALHAQCFCIGAISWRCLRPHRSFQPPSLTTCVYRRRVSFIDDPAISSVFSPPARKEVEADVATTSLMGTHLGTCGGSLLEAIPQVDRGLLGAARGKGSRWQGSRQTPAPSPHHRIPAIWQRTFAAARFAASISKGALIGRRRTPRPPVCRAPLFLYFRIIEPLGGTF